MAENSANSYREKEKIMNILFAAGRAFQSGKSFTFPTTFSIVAACDEAFTIPYFKRRGFNHSACIMHGMKFFLDQDADKLLKDFSELFESFGGDASNNDQPSPRPRQTRPPRMVIPHARRPDTSRAQTGTVTQPAPAEAQIVDQAPANENNQAAQIPANGQAQMAVGISLNQIDQMNVSSLHGDAPPAPAQINDQVEMDIEPPEIEVQPINEARLSVLRQEVPNISHDDRASIEQPQRPAQLPRLSSTAKVDVAPNVLQHQDQQPEQPKHHEIGAEHGPNLMIENPPAAVPNQPQVREQADENLVRDLDMVQIYDDLNIVPAENQDVLRRPQRLAGRRVFRQEMLEDVLIEENGQFVRIGPRPVPPEIIENQEAVQQPRLRRRRGQRQPPQAPEAPPPPQDGLAAVVHHPAGHLEAIPEQHEVLVDIPDPINIQINENQPEQHEVLVDIPDPINIQINENQAIPQIQNAPAINQINIEEDEPMPIARRRTTSHSLDVPVNNISAARVSVAPLAEQPEPGIVLVDIEPVYIAPADNVPEEIVPANVPISPSVVEVLQPINQNRLRNGVDFLQILSRRRRSRASNIPALERSDYDEYLNSLQPAVTIDLLELITSAVDVLPESQRLAELLADQDIVRMDQIQFEGHGAIAQEQRINQIIALAQLASAGIINIIKNGEGEPEAIQLAETPDLHWDLADEDGDSDDSGSDDALHPDDADNSDDAIAEEDDDVEENSSSDINFDYDSADSAESEEFVQPDSARPSPAN